MPSGVIKILCLLSLISSYIFALSGTGGVPLGGMGTGYLVFRDSKISVSGKMPPAAADHCKTNPVEKQLSSSGFHLFAGGTAKSPAKVVSEDAKCPVQRADFGSIGSVKFTLNAFGPYWPGEGKLKHQLATSPLALFDITAVNGGAEAVDVAVALEAPLGSSSGKVETGNKAISFSGSPLNSYLAVDCDGATPTFTAGAIGTFANDGKLSNTDGNLVAAKCSVPGGGKVHFKFVAAWYTTYDDEGYYYHNFYKNSKEAAEAGLANFDGIRDGITSFVDRVMASNFPEWYKDRLLNNTYPLIHNSVCAKDGRVAFWEGNYGIIGTIDQGQHAAVFYSFNWPAVQWHELQYWARQQKTSGQIHHDFNQGTQSFTPGSTANNRHLKAWDDKTHPDYWWFSNTDTWADLNCMFIFKAYELMLATGDVDSLKKSWSALKKAAERLISQCESDGIPLKSHSTYDRCNGAGDATGSNCSLTPEYNGGLTIATFRAMAEMARFLGESSSVTTYTEHANKAEQAFKAKYENSNTFGKEASVDKSGRFPESHVAGYSWANYFCLTPIMNESFITKAVERLRALQKNPPSRDAVRATGEWIFYCVDHYGGAEIAINRPDDGLYIHKLDYDYYYKAAPDMVFWQSLQEGDGNRHKDSYMTAPMVWHSYFQFCGYMIDNANKRLWIRPRIPTEMKGEIKNAILLNPKGYGTLNYKELTNSDTTQIIKVAFDNPVTISEIVLKNNTDKNEPSVLVNGASASAKAEGVSPEKNIRVTFTNPIQIGPEGVNITVLKVPVKNVIPFEVIRYFVNDLQSTPVIKWKPVVFSTKSVGHVTIEALSLNGAKIGTLYSGNIGPGRHSFLWTGTTLEGKLIGNSTIILRLITESEIISRPILVIE